MNNAAVIVTYGDRISYLRQVIKALLEEHLEAIVIVSNGSEDNSLAEIKRLTECHGIISLIDLETNTGSANAFRKGIDSALHHGADYIWLLDDDTQPKPGALKALVKHWNLTNPNNSKLLALLSSRSDRKIYKEAIQSQSPYAILGPKNSFLGFDLYQKVKSLIVKSRAEYNTDITFGQVAVAPYGGLFFHRNVIEAIGLPDTDFFLYADDHEFSYRITQQHGEIILVLKSELVDLETSFHLRPSKNILSTRYFATNSKEAIYYSVRNNVYFERQFIDNRVRYSLNKFVYLSMLFAVMLLHPNQFWKFKVILKAIGHSKKFKNHD